MEDKELINLIEECCNDIFDRTEPLANVKSRLYETLKDKVKLTEPVVSSMFKEVNKIDIEDYDTSTVWVLNLNYDNKQNHILDHIDPSSVKIEYLKRRP